MVKTLSKTPENVPGGLTNLVNCTESTAKGSSKKQRVQPANWCLKTNDGRKRCDRTRQAGRAKSPSTLTTSMQKGRRRPGSACEDPSETPSLAANATSGRARPRWRRCCGTAARSWVPRGRPVQLTGVTQSLTPLFGVGGRAAQQLLSGQLGVSEAVASAIGMRGARAACNAERRYGDRRPRLRARR
jgi:hypothetical protein